MTDVKLDKMLQRGGTATSWTSANPVLSARELGVETDTGNVKVGNGVDPWNALPYVGGSIDQVVNVTLTPTQIANLDTAPVTLISAPGVGLVSIVKTIEFFLDYQTTPYVGGGILQLQYAGTSPPNNNINIGDGQLLAIGVTASIHSFAAAMAPARKIFADTAIEVATTASTTGGDSNVKLRVTYETRTILS